MVDGDLKFLFNGLLPGYIELVEEGSSDLRMDEGLETAILLSLFSDARALEGDDLPFGSDKRGFWGDVILGYSFGSKLWTLERGKITNKTLGVIETYMGSALQWMLEDGVVSDVGVSATRSGDLVLMEVIIYRDGEEPLSTKYSLNWERMIEESKGL
jgi:phage gp46-like protein